MSCTRADGQQSTFDAFIIVPTHMADCIASVMMSLHIMCSHLKCIKSCQLCCLRCCRALQIRRKQYCWPSLFVQQDLLQIPEVVVMVEVLIEQPCYRWWQHAFGQQMCEQDDKVFTLRIDGGCCLSPSAIPSAWQFHSWLLCCWLVLGITRSQSDQMLRAS